MGRVGLARNVLHWHMQGDCLQLEAGVRVAPTEAVLQDSPYDQNGPYTCGLHAEDPKFYSLPLQLKGYQEVGLGKTSA